MSKFTELIIRFLLRKEEAIMDVVLVTLIVNGERFYKNLRPAMKKRAKPLLIALEREDLIVEDESPKA